MKQKIILIMVLIILIILIIPKEKEGLRIRVIANSDSQYDQVIKMGVVNIVKREISSYDQENIIEEVTNNLDNLDSKISRYLKDTKYIIKIDKVRFPTKELNGEVIPGGIYKTLLIVINEGKGKNWWSLLNPSYHNISFEDMETGEVEFKFFLWEEIKKSLYKD